MHLSWHLDPNRKSIYLILGGISPSSFVSPIISSKLNRHRSSIQKVFKTAIAKIRESYNE